MVIEVKRVYEQPDAQDGVRVLVDRVWPRGLKKEQLQADAWMKDVAPSMELRKWFNHDPVNWEEFKKRYFAQLDANQEAVGLLLELAGKNRLTLLYAARDPDHNQAIALREYLIDRSRTNR